MEKKSRKPNKTKYSKGRLNGHVKVYDRHLLYIKSMKISCTPDYLENVIKDFAKEFGTVCQIRIMVDGEVIGSSFSKLKSEFSSANQNRQLPQKKHLYSGYVRFLNLESVSLIIAATKYCLEEFPSELKDAVFLYGTNKVCKSFIYGDKCSSLRCNFIHNQVNSIDIVESQLQSSSRAKSFKSHTLMSNHQAYALSTMKDLQFVESSKFINILLTKIHSRSSSKINNEEMLLNYACARGAFPKVPRELGTIRNEKRLHSYLCPSKKRQQQSLIDDSGYSLIVLNARNTLEETTNRNNLEVWPEQLRYRKTRSSLLNSQHLRTLVFFFAKQNGGRAHESLFGNYDFGEELDELINFKFKKRSEGNIQFNTLVGKRSKNYKNDSSEKLSVVFGEPSDPIYNFEC